MNLFFSKISENPWYLAGFIALVVWTIIWKGLALWKAGRSNDLIWFIVILIVNSLGALEIIYIFLINRKRNITK